MPAPVATWVDDTWPTAKSLDISLYAYDTGATEPNGVTTPNGIAFHAQRPLLVESYTRTPTLTTSSTGHQSVLSTSAGTTSCFVIVDTAGYYGQSCDQPGGRGYYQFLAAVQGSGGDGVTPGGWMLLSHFAAIAHGATQTSVSADLTGTAQPSVSGTRQIPSSSYDTCAFFLDLVNVGATVTWSPAVTIWDSASASATTVVDTVDPSGETCRLCALWAAVSASTQGIAVYNIGGTYPFTAPAGVTTVSVSEQGSAAGGGAGNVSGGGTEYGGGGGGGGEDAQGTITVTPFSNYTVNVGAGGVGGTAPGGSGGAGALTQIAGDGGTQVIAHGGSAGAGATTSADGAGGAGGTGSSAPTHYNGGAGANGATGSYGGGGGSSAGTGQAGNSATSAAGAPAPMGGGPGGTGGQAAIAVVQSATGSNNQAKTLTVNFRNAVQAGNAVICAVLYQGKPSAVSGSFNPPTAALSDGTALSRDVAADNSGISTYEQMGLYSVFSVTGGQTGVTVTGFASTTQGDFRAFCVQMWEVTGLGAGSLDAQAGNAQGGGTDFNTYSASAATTHAPEFWVGVAGGQQNSSFNLNPPSGSQGWTVFGQTGQSAGAHGNTIYSRMIAGYQVQAATGTAKYSGTISKKVSTAAIVGTYTTAAMTAGTSPVIGPAGGGGAGLGAANNGGAGADGQMTLTWTGQSGGAYGNPLLPAPYTNWSAETTVGTTGAANVNLNGNTGIRDVLNFLSNPPVFRVSGVAAQSLTSAALTAVAFTGGTVSVDSYAGWNSGTATYTVQRDGLYLFHGLVCFAQASGGGRRAAATVNGTSYWGPVMPTTTAGTANVPKTQILALHAGDTVQLSARQDSGSPVALATTDQTRFLLVWLAEIGVPPSLWSPPDPTFRWATGTQGENLGGNFGALAQQHLGNDLGFLCGRPYLLAHQVTAQSGLTSGTFSTVTLDTVGGLAHPADSGDNYSGWTSGASNSYTAQVPGWYLMTGEFFATNPSSSGATVTAGILPSTSGGVTPHTTPDYYQAMVAPTSSGTGGGGTVFGLQYMAAGEKITPQIMGQGYSAPYGTITGTVNAGVFASHLELVWMSL